MFSTRVLLTFVLLVALALAQSDEEKKVGTPGPPGPHKGGKHGPHGHGGPLGAVFKELSAEQKEELKKVFKESKDKTKKEAKEALDKFVQSLPQELQDKVKKAEEKKQEFVAKLKEKVEKAQLSEEAKQLLEKVQAVFKNEDITKKAEHEQIKELVKGADKKVLEELKKAHIPVPGAHPKFHGKPHGRHHRHHSTTAAPSA